MSCLDCFLGECFLVVAHDETVFVGIRQFDTRIGIYGEDISLVFSPAKEGWGKGSVVSKT